MKRGDELVGVMLYCYPPINCIGRKKAFHGRIFSAAEVNEKFAIITRLILHAKYRTIGLGARLVRETLPLVRLPYIEAIAVMSRYNPFFKKAGMRKIMERFPDHEITEAIEQLRQMGFEPTLLSSIHYNLEKMKNMNPMKIMKCREILAKLRSRRLHKFADSHAPYGRNAWCQNVVEKASLEKLAKVLKALSFF